MQLCHLLPYFRHAYYATFVPHGTPGNKLPVGDFGGGEPITTCKDVPGYLTDWWTDRERQGAPIES